MSCMVLAAATLQGCGGGTGGSEPEPVLGAAQEADYSTVDSAFASSPVVGDNILTGLVIPAAAAQAAQPATNETSPNPATVDSNETTEPTEPVVPDETAAPVSVPEPVQPAEPPAEPEELAVAEAPKPPTANAEPEEAEPIAEAEAEVEPATTEPTEQPTAVDEEQAPAVAAEVPAAAMPAEQTAGFANELPSSIQCMEFPETNIGFGSVDNDDWRAWVAPTKHRYSGSNQHLSISQSDDGVPTLRQQLVPSSKGSQTVAAGAYLTSANTYRLTQSIFLEPGFDWGGKNEGGKLGFGFGGGSAPSGGLLQTDGFTVRFMWRGNKDGTAHMVIYSYAADRNQSLPYGDDHPLESFVVPVGEWFDLGMEITVNSAIEKSDGSLRAWANGELALQLDNIQWQSSGDKPAVQGLTYSTFYGGADSSWSPDHTTHIRFANVCWSPVLDDFEPLIPEISSAKNAEQFWATKDSEGTIFSDFTEAEAPVADFNEFADSPRASIITALTDMELILPAENELINWHFYNALDRLNEALDVADWSTNYALKTNANTITHIYEAVRDAQAASRIEAAPAFILSQIKAVSQSLTLVAADLAEEQIERAKNAVTQSTCNAQNPSSNCLRANLLLAQANTDLASALELLTSAPLSSIEHAEQARKDAVAAIAILQTNN